MAPIHLQPLLEIYCFPREQERLHANKRSAVDGIDVLDSLANEGYIHYPAEGENIAQITDKGLVFITAVLNTPEPVKTWTIPIGHKE